MPRNQGEEQRKAMAWLEVASKYPENANIQNALIDVARALDKDPADALIDQKTRDAMNERTEAQGGDGGERPTPLSPVVMQGGGA